VDKKVVVISHLSQISLQSQLRDLCHCSALSAQGKDGLLAEHQLGVFV